MGNRKWRLNARRRNAFVQGFKRYQEKGISVLIDGKEADDTLWKKLFEVRSDGGFYMGDYIFEDAPGTEIADRARENKKRFENEKAGQAEGVREGTDPYGHCPENEAEKDFLESQDFQMQFQTGKKILKQIRFDLVYNK